MENLAYSEWGALEYRQVLASMIAPVGIRSLPAMCDGFGTILLNRPIFALNMARVGLTIALRILRSKRPDASDVVVPAYICPSVVQAVRAAGLRPVPVDIGRDLNLDIDALTNSISPSTLAVIAAHMYGCPAPIREIEAICHRCGVYLIDDAAQVAGVSVDGQPLGTFGDFGIMSFSQSKTIVAGSRNAGGLLIVNNSQFEAQATAAYEALPAARGCFSDIASFVWRYMLAQWTETPTYYLGRFLGQNDRPESVARATKMNRVIAGLALAQFKSLEKRIAGRRRVANLYQQKISAQHEIGFPQFESGRYLTRIVLTLPEGTNLAEIRADLLRKGVATRRGYPVYGSELARRPERAMNLQPRLLELPSHSEMPDVTVDKIWSALLATLKMQTEQKGISHSVVFAGDAQAK
jgi:perosamine synthetase